MAEKFEVIGAVNDVRIIAVNTSIREKPVLIQRFGQGRWRKMKGIAMIRYVNGRVARAELHWYEAHGVGRRAWKVKRELL